LEGFVKRDQALVLTCVVVLFLGVGVSLTRMQERSSVILPAIDEVRASTAPWRARSLTPVPNIDTELQPQAKRARPYRVSASPNGEKVYVTLAGTEIAPGDEVAVIDATTRKEMARIHVGSQPYGLAMHPSGRWLIVTNRFSNFLSVIDIASDQVVTRIPVEFYSEDLVVSADGHTAYLSNFFLNQVLIVDLTIEADTLMGMQRQLDFDRTDFMPRPAQSDKQNQPSDTSNTDTRDSSGVYTSLRLSCGTSSCHMYSAGGFVAGPDLEQTFTSAKVHAWPHDPDSSPLLRAVTSVAQGGWADSTTGYHHPGGVIFSDPANDPAYIALRSWIAGGHTGPGISVGDKPRDLLLSPDQQTLYVANTGSLDISVVDLTTLREYRRIATRSPVNDLVWAGEKLVLATLGVGSGHPKARHAGRESTDRNHPEAEFTLFRNPQSGSPKPLPLELQEPLGPYDDVDGTAQQKFRDITNDIVLLDPTVTSVARYSANEDFTRYTSDSFEALAGDKKGDVLPELMQVVGAFPEQIVSIDDRLYITMAGTFQVQEWHVAPAAVPAKRLVPGRVFATGFKPTGITVAANNTLVIANQLDESVTFIDLASGASSQLSLSRLAEKFPANDFERGEFFVQTSIFSVDQDQSCVHCHYRDTSDGKKWSVSQVMGQNRAGDEVTGGSREVPDLRALIHKVPFFVEGILSLDEPLTMMMEHNPLVDFSGRTPVGDFSGIVASNDEQGRYPKSADAIIVATGRAWADSKVRVVDLTKRRDQFFRSQTLHYLGKELDLRDMQRMIGAYQSAEPRLLPSPVDPADPMVRHGRELFESPQVGCTGCHPAPTFADKEHVYNQNKSFRPLVSSVPRDNIHTLISADYLDQINNFVRYWDKLDTGRFEEHEGNFVAPSLHNIWARPPRFLHHGNAISLREVIATPEHPALQRMPFPRFQADRPGGWERGLNELDGLFDTHGTTSHLSVWDIECLIKYLRSIE
jgi:YVTN family beta-propeller protein